MSGPRRLTVAGLILAATWVMTPTVMAQVEEAVVPTTLEAWYTVTPVSAPPGLPPVDPYPPDTLHVGLTRGAEDSRTYLTLDLGSVPVASIVGGVLELPVDPDGGSRDVPAASFEACPVDDPGPEVAGSLDPPPEVDCSVRAPAVLDDDADGGPRFTVDLRAIADRLGDGGLALVPTDAARAEGASWHVALFGRDNVSADASPISATLDLQPAIDPDGPPTRVGASIVSPPPGRTDQSSVALTDFGSPGQLPTVPSPTAFKVPARGASVAPPPASAGAPSPSAAPVPSASVASPPLVPAVSVGPEGFRYGAVFGLPFALLAFVGYFGAALTRNADPPPPRRPTAA